MMQLRVNRFCLFVLCILFVAVVASSGVHLPVRRRGGRFSRHDETNLTSLRCIVKDTEDRFTQTYRNVDNNRLVRRWRTSHDIVDHSGLLQAVGSTGNWYAVINVGEPFQRLEFDLEMLSPDFYTLMTTSAYGSKYNTFFSSTHHSDGQHIHPLCQKSTDLFQLAPSELPVRLEFPVCKPPQTSTYTLAASGSTIGLAPPGSLTRLPGFSLPDQLHTHALVSSKMWSLTLLDGENGVLTFGGAIAKEVEQAKVQAELELQHFGDPKADREWISKQTQAKLEVSMPALMPWESHLKWTNLQGAAGWWTALVSGVWINGAKVLKNQPVLFDLQCPFILAPPSATDTFYRSIGGVFRLPSPNDQFFAFPCLNSKSINIALEIAGWNFPILSGRTTRGESLHGPTGGSFSLGKMGNGTGYCIGIVVETRLGLSEEGMESGMQNMWVLGEPFFRGMGVVFDADGGRIGLRSY